MLLSSVFGETQLASQRVTSTVQGPSPRSDQVGVVVIGRNEGERLLACLQSVRAAVEHLVYVDSGSTDGSPGRARAAGACVVELDGERPMTAARARNAGFERLLATVPGLEFVQFVDGDCVLTPGWIERALAELGSRPDVAVVCGRRRERFPDHSIYNRLCDIEWDGPTGEVGACGGDAMMRVAAVVAARGFRSSMIAGEEPELCARLRDQGNKVVRLGADMTVHDAHMERFGQWWRRMMRAGHAYIEGRCLHGRSPQRLRVRETNRILLWAVVLPLLALGGAWFTGGASLWLLLAYPLQFLRIFRRTRRRPLPAADAALYALSCTLGWFAQAAGALGFLFRRLLGTRDTLIEYKEPAAR